MKKLLKVILVLFGSGSLYALPLGNPQEPALLCDGLFWEGGCYEFCQPGVSWCEAISFRFGYYGDFVFNRHVEVDDNDFDRDIEHTYVFTNAGYLVCNFWNCVDFFLTLGITNLWFTTNSNAFGTFAAETGNAIRYEIETESHFSWSVGFRAILFEWCCYTLGMEAQYFTTHPNIKRITVDASTSIYPDHILDMKYREWQIGFGIARRIWNLVPYLGVKFSRACIDSDHAQLSSGESLFTNSTLFDLKSKHFFGYVVGVSLIDCERAAITVETRFPDEKAIYVNGQIRF